MYYIKGAKCITLKGQEKGRHTAKKGEGTKVWLIYMHGDDKRESHILISFLFTLEID